LRWWQDYQVQMLSQEAERIRSTVLPDWLAWQQHWEQANQSVLRNSDHELDRTQLQHISAQLVALSDRLASPYLHKALPLALQWAVQPWQADWSWQLALCSTAVVEPAARTQLLICCVQQLCEVLAGAVILPQQSLLQLQSAVELELVLGCHYATELPIDLTEAAIATLSPWLETFAILTNGKYYFTLRPLSLELVLIWQPQP
jgi:hypothetical protein